MDGGENCRENEEPLEQSTGDRERCAAAHPKGLRRLNADELAYHISLSLSLTLAANFTYLNEYTYCTVQ